MILYLSSPPGFGDEYASVTWEEVRLTIAYPPGIPDEALLGQ